MRPIVTVNYLQQSFPGYDLDWLWVSEKLQLDLAHIQLLRDFQSQWQQHDPRLLLALLFLVDAVNRGSLCLLINDDDLQKHACSLQLTGIEKHINKLDLRELKLSSRTVLVLDQGRLYFQKHHFQEALLQKDLSTLITQSEAEVFSHDAIKKHANTVVGSLPYQLDGQQIQALLTSLLQPFSIVSGGPGTGKTTILLSLLRVLVRLGVDVKKIALAAPTGRAANRMTESIENGLTVIGETGDLTFEDIKAMSSTTIHRMLGANPQSRKNRFHANNWLPYEVVVIDEVSMVDLELMNQLIQAISARTKLIFLGDQFQLPSVQSGALLADLMPPVGYDGLNTLAFLATLQKLWPINGQSLSSQSTTQKAQLLTDRVTVLQVSKRCQPHIAMLSEQVRQGDAGSFLNKVNKLAGDVYSIWSQETQIDGVSWQGHKDHQNNSKKLYQTWFAHFYAGVSAAGLSYVEMVQTLRYRQIGRVGVKPESLAVIFSLIKSQRILTLTHRGRNGTESINGLIGGWLKSSLGVEGMDDCFHGAIIMIKRNDATLGLYNGDIGLVLEVAVNQFQVFFESAGNFQCFSIHLIPDYRLAFAMTVHKSQGSEFNHVLLPLTENLESPLLSREIIYTGMTRAKKSVLIFGSEKALKQAIINKTVRNSGLTFWSDPENSCTSGA